MPGRNDSSTNSLRNAALAFLPGRWVISLFCFCAGRQAGRNGILSFLPGSWCISPFGSCAGRCVMNSPFSCLTEGVHVVEDRAVLSHTEALHLTQEPVLQGRMLCFELACGEHPCWCLHLLQQLKVCCNPGPWKQPTLHLMSRGNVKVGLQCILTANAAGSSWQASPPLSPVPQGRIACSGPLRMLGQCSFPLLLGSSLLSLTHLSLGPEPYEPCCRWSPSARSPGSRCCGRWPARPWWLAEACSTAGEASISSVFRWTGGFGRRLAGLCSTVGSTKRLNAVRGGMAHRQCALQRMAVLAVCMNSCANVHQCCHPPSCC